MLVVQALSVSLSLCLCLSLSLSLLSISPVLEREPGREKEKEGERASEQPKSDQIIKTHYQSAEESGAGCLEMWMGEILLKKASYGR